MDRKLCEKIAQIDFKTFETIAEYITYRTYTIHKKMETCLKDDIQLHQGAIAELKTLERIRKDALAIIERG